VTVPQVSPLQHSPGVTQEVPSVLQHSPLDASQLSEAFAQHCWLVVHWYGCPGPELLGPRQALQVCSPAGPVQVSGAQHAVDPPPATQDVPAPEQQVPGTPGDVELHRPLAHSSPSRQAPPSACEPSG
jgi:hypothetical protein